MAAALSELVHATTTGNPLRVIPGALRRRFRIGMSGESALLTVGGTEAAINCFRLQPAHMKEAEVVWRMTVDRFRAVLKRRRPNDGSEAMRIRKEFMNRLRTVIDGRITGRGGSTEWGRVAPAPVVRRSSDRRASIQAIAAAAAAVCGN